MYLYDLLSDDMKWIQAFVADEEKYLMEKVTRLFAESNARKKNMVYFIHFNIWRMPNNDV
jgi:hypothetical protein